MITPPRLEYYGDIAQAQAMKGAALQFFSFCCLGIGESATITRTKKPIDGVIFQATVNKDPYGNLFGVVRINVETSGGETLGKIYITYPDRWSAYSDTDWVKFRKSDRLERQKPFDVVNVNYYAGGTLNQSISEVSSPNKICIGGYWINADYSDCISFTRDTVYYDGKYKRFTWIETDTDYGILAASISKDGKKIFLITGKIYSGWYTTKHAYSSCAYDDVDLWVYEIGTPTGYEHDLTELYHASVISIGVAFTDEIMAGFFNNPLVFWLYHRDFSTGDKTLTKYTIDTADYSTSTDSLYSINDYDLATGIDNIFRETISVTSAGDCSLYKLNGATLDAVTTDITDNGNIYMFMFADIKKNVFIYAKKTSTDGYHKLWFKGTIYDINDLAITDTDGRIVNTNDYPYMYNNFFTYAYNNKFLVCCFKLFTLIIDCTANSLSYKKYNYRFDAFNTSSGESNINYTPLSVIKAGTK